MARPQKGISRDIKKQLRVQKHIKVPATVAKTLRAYITEQVDINMKRRSAFMKRAEKWRTILGGNRPTPTSRRRTSSSNLSVPLMIWARVAVRARLTESILENRPLVSVDPGAGFSTFLPQSELSPQSICNSLAKFLQTEILSVRGLEGRAAINSVAAESVDLGSAAIKVYIEPDIVKKVKDDTTTLPARVVFPGEVKWAFISYLDLIYANGYGTDTQKMPYVGHLFKRTWSEIKSFGMMGHYNEEQVKKVEQAYNDSSESSKPIEAREHDIIELYLDWDVDEDGLQESILIDWHVKQQDWLRVVWNPTPEGRRPILANQFDIPPKVTDLRGQGVSEKLEGSQDEADAVHNIAIEAGKRGAAHAVVIKQNTRAEEDFGGEDDILPGDVIVTDNPKEDVVNVPLGDPRAGVSGIQLEEHTRLYVTRILGLDEARVGNVESGKRVAASVGMATLREGRMIIKTALTSISHLLDEAVYLTLSLYQRRIPEAQLVAAVGPDTARLLMGSVFSITDPKILRDSFVIKVNSQDAAISQENRRQEMTMISQALFPFYDRLQQLVLLIVSPQTPPQAREALTLIVERMERSMEALLNTMDTITNPEDLLIKVNELTEILNKTPETQPQIPAVGIEAEESPFGELGAGVV